MEERRAARGLERAQDRAADCEVALREAKEKIPIAEKIYADAEAELKAARAE